MTTTNTHTHTPGREAMEAAKRITFLTCPESGCQDGVIDSGGLSPWGSGINIPCPSCEHNLKHLDDLTAVVQRAIDQAKAAESDLLGRALKTLRQIEPYLGDLCEHGVLDLHSAFKPWLSARAILAETEGK